MSVSALFSTPSVQSLSLALNEASLRQQAISSNIANVNTPGFKRLDVSSSFESAFKDALSTLGSGGTFDSSTMPVGTLTEAADQGPARPDGNTVQIEGEVLGLAQNSARYEFASEMLANSFHGMKSAISGNVG
jgi:flagellar basal-body rod protein FlgB